MKKIYSSIDIGSKSIKVIVSEMHKNKMNVLATAKVPSKSIKNGVIEDINELIPEIKKAFKEVEGMLGLKIKKTIAVIPSSYLDLSVETGMTTITNEEKEVTGNDIVRAMQGAIYNKLPSNKELASIIPVSFSLDDKEGIKDPKGMVGDQLGVSLLMIKAPKSNTHFIANAIEKAGINVVDIAPSSICDYAELKDMETNTNAGAFINIGHDLTTVSIFNKGILVGAETINLGGKCIEQDLSYIYKISLEEGETIKKLFAIADPSEASTEEIYKVVNIEKKEIKINQKEISEIIKARIEEILKLSEKQINLLTKRKIDYIIITGGTSELEGFENIVKKIFLNAKVGKIKTIGIRSNEFSVASGALKYFDEKLTLRGKYFSMFTKDMEKELVSSKKKILNFSDDSVIGKIFGYFFEN